MKRDYGITVEDYHALEKSQGYVCAICKKPESNRWSVDVPFSLAVDHDHNTGIVRGLLCGNCNTGIGKFYDSKELLESAIRYLDRAPEGGK